MTDIGPATNTMFMPAASDGLNCNLVLLISLIHVEQIRIRKPQPS
jgi:hypothetical protein